MKRFVLSLALLLALAPALVAQDQITVSSTQKALVTKRTATWCTICGGFAWDMMERLESGYDSTQVVFVKAHHSSSSRLHSKVAEAWIDAFESSFSQPRFYVGVDVIGSGTPSVETTIEERIETLNTTSPVVQAGMDLAYEPISRRLRVRAAIAFFQSEAEGSYRLGLYLVERSVREEQASRSSAATHVNVLRESLTEDPFGTLLHSGTTVAGERFNTELFYTLPEDYDMDNVQILAVIWDDSDEQIQVVNATGTSSYSLMQTTGLNKPLLAGQFRILGNPVSNDLQLEVSLEQPASDLHWSIVDVSGRIRQQGNWGGLSQHTQRQTIQVSSLEKGTFMLRLTDGKAVRQLPFVRQ